jgi:hypothetical protein
VLKQVDYDSKWLREYIILTAMTRGILRWYHLPEFRFLEQYKNIPRGAIPFLLANPDPNGKPALCGPFKAASQIYKFNKNHLLSCSLLGGVPSEAQFPTQAFYSHRSSEMFIDRKVAFEKLGFGPVNNLISENQCKMLSLTIKEYIRQFYPDQIFYDLQVTKGICSHRGHVIKFDIYAEDPIELIGRMRYYFSARRSYSGH